MRKDRILWVDDEIEMLRPYLLFLDEKGYEVVTATNGNDAVDICQKESFDIIFLDENMPGLSGLETLALIKEIDSDVPLVMITKNEEENIMNMAIGNKIADYLTKPVNPSQILMTLKKNIHRKEIVNEHATAAYRSEFGQIGMKINDSFTYDDWVEVYKKLVFWELELSETDSGMDEMLRMQKMDANTTFSKFIKNNYERWFEHPEERPLMSFEIFKTKVFPLLDNDEKVFFVVVDNFRLDQWKMIRELLSDYYQFEEEELYCSILPTATQYARNAIFSGLMPLQIQQMFPQFWVEEEEEEGKNLMESELLQTQIQRFRKKYTFSYHKINDSVSCQRLIDQLPHLENNNLNVCVLNFIDMLSHARTESKMVRELANDEKAYRSLTLSWFRHSATFDLFRAIAERGYKVVFTTDHGTIRVNNPIKVVGDKNTNVNLRYKVGKNLSYNRKEVFEVTQPAKIGLPSPNVSSAYIFACNDDFFAYPNNYNYYVSYYKNTFQHGGVSLEEMLVPLIVMNPK
ncbi:bifunctional response regulator/alkaline phosphatase family protein [Porphyromonadaceae sp. NP-X]|jgi:CheY-like chemotaxis protein|nr:PglZ domain-containing protein [Paludibacteraceae bacterium]MBP9016177.1 PglZ domain-containing protein [Paludibacteraceae bacterium]MDS1032345.1 bifunctional response regulator/alkaline phosphatase family protein [Porphyromonadaceae sp. NP-X]NLJ19640.1 bifunctional response regulator/alkaline phosphatase family protein [Bacteroidales bacterium]